MANAPTTAPTESPSLRSTRVYVKAVLCLIVGLAVGYLLHASRSSTSPAQPAITPRQPSAPAGMMSSGHMHNPAEMKQVADKQAAPLLERLKSDPKNSALMVQVGAIYHGLHQFKEAAAYYDMAVRAEPKNVAIRTKLATSLYRDGDVDGAIAQLNQALSYDPKDADSLFDLGMIKLQGKRDGRGALAAWQRLLKSNPQLSTERKATVQKLIASVLTMLSDQNGIQEARRDDGYKSNTN
jgi:cytochrome c-type biogenesis protein CcmH/NrfG